MDMKNCLLRHHPCLNAKAEMDTATHLSICMNSDCNKVDWIFVAAIQAQRKWYTKTIIKDSSRDFELGAISY